MREIERKTMRETKFDKICKLEFNCYPCMDVMQRKFASKDWSDMNETLKNYPKTEDGIIKWISDWHEHLIQTAAKELTSEVLEIIYNDLKLNDDFLNAPYKIEFDAYNYTLKSHFNHNEDRDEGDVQFYNVVYWTKLTDYEHLFEDDNEVDLVWKNIESSLHYALSSYNNILDREDCNEEKDLI